MAEKKDKIYVGSGKKTQYEGQVNFTLVVDKIPNEFYYDYKGLKCVNLTLSLKKDGVDQYGKTHTVTINEYKPEPKKINEGYVKTEPIKDIPYAENDETSLPF